MKGHCVLAAFAVLNATASAVAIPETSDLTSSHGPAQPRDDPAASLFSDLWKRRGGGGSGGRGGGSSSSGGESGSSSSGKTGSSSSGGSSSSSGRGSSISSTGGRTTTGSGVAPAYGGGRYYGGGSTVPYRAGARSTGGLSPLPFLFAGTAIAFWPGIWYHPAYLYPYSNPWTYHNASSGRNETKPVTCGCDAYQECACDDNSNSTYVNSVIGNGTNLNQSLVSVGNVNGTETILINGTLANGTTASGGSESPSAGTGMRDLAQMAGWWPGMATVVAMVILC